MENIENSKKVIEDIIEKAYMPLTTSDFFKNLKIRSRVEKDRIRQILEDLHLDGKIRYDSFTGMKEKVIFPNLTNKLAQSIEFPGQIFDTKDQNTQIFVGYGDLETIGKISRVVGFRGNAEGFQRMKQRSWVLELSRVFGLTDTFLFTSIVLYIDSDDVTFKENQLSIKSVNWKYEHEKPALIVDGQQRCHAFHELKIAANDVKTLFTPLVVISGKPKDMDLMEFLKILFINANKAKPLPTSLIDQLLATIEDIQDRTIVDSSKKGSRYSKIVKELDELENSPLYDKIAWEYKEDPASYPMRFSIIQYQVKFLENHILNYVAREHFDDELLTNITMDIYSAIGNVYRDVFEIIMKDSRAIGPLFMFIAKTLSAETIFQDDRVTKYTETLEKIEEYIALKPDPKGSRKWLDEGDWSPEKLDGRSRIAIEKAANQLLDIYISVIRSG